MHSPSVAVIGHHDLSRRVLRVLGTHDDPLEPEVLGNDGLLDAGAVD